jgi:hypothetical protein
MKSGRAGQAKKAARNAARPRGIVNILNYPLYFYH